MPRLPKGIDRLPSGVYRGRFMHDGVRYSTGPCSTITEAKNSLAALRGDVVRGEWVASKGGITLDEWFARWNPTRAVRETTKIEDQQRYDRHIKPVLGARTLRSITPDVVAHFQTRPQVSGATNRRIWSLLSASLGRKGALRAGLVRANPCAAVQAPQAQRTTFQALTSTQVQALVEAMPTEHRPVFLTAVLTGIRWSELVGLAVEDWRREQGVLHVHRSVIEQAGRFYPGPTKQHAARLIPVHPDLARVLADYLGDRTRGPIFLTGAGTPLRHSNFRRDAWLPALTATGIACRWHDLRHTAASLMLANGADLTTVRDVLGHSSVHTTSLYLHTTDERKRAAIDSLPTLRLGGEGLRDQRGTLGLGNALVDQDHGVAVVVQPSDPDTLDWHLACPDNEHANPLASVNGTSVARAVVNGT